MSETVNYYQSNKMSIMLESVYTYTYNLSEKILPG